MSNNERERRIEHYRTESQKIDAEVNCGHNIEGICQRLKALNEEAQKSGDYDYSLYFQSELDFYSDAEDVKKSIQDISDALDWQDTEGHPKDYFLLRHLGVIYEQVNNFKEAIRYFDRALEIYPDYCEAQVQKGISLSNSGKFNEAIKVFEKALLLDNRHPGTLTGLGTAWINKDKHIIAIKYLQQANEIQPKNYITLRNLGISYQRINEFEKAVNSFEEALKVKEDDTFSLFALGVVFLQQGKEAMALEKFTRVNEIHEGSCEYEIWSTKELIENHKESSKLNEQFQKYLEKKRKEEESINKVLFKASKLNPLCSVFLFLRRWNSYTPAIPKELENEAIEIGENVENVGGGYFLWHAGEGTIIDPGYKFLENFLKAGCTLSDVCNVIITHSHDDHTHQFEQLCTLLHQYNENCEKRGLKKLKIRFYLSAGTFMKFSGVIDLNDYDYVEHIYVLNPGTEYDLKAGVMRVLSAYHHEIRSRDQAVGLLFELDLPKNTDVDASNVPRKAEKHRILLTSDTGLFPQEIEGYSKKPASRFGKKIHDLYKDKHGVNEKEIDLMILHIGSIKEVEKDSILVSFENIHLPHTVCYPNHLGYLGTREVIRHILPKIAVLSEWGEEMRYFRIPLCKDIQYYVDFYAKRAEHSINVLPADIPLIYCFFDQTKDAEKSAKIWDCVSEKWVKAESIKYASTEKNGGGKIFYMENASDFEGDERNNKSRESIFNGTLKIREKIYFKQD